MSKTPIELVEVKPVGQFLINSGKGTDLCDGTYYHYSEACVLLKQYAQREREPIEKQLAKARADTGQMRTALQALYSWVKAEAEHFGANIPDDDMTAMVEAALATERGE